MNNWGSNHGVLNYGHIGDEFITLASMLRIPVKMHNVPEERVFRPSAWAGVGAADLEGADYRACSNFGPLYGKTREFRGLDSSRSTIFSMPGQLRHPESLLSN